MKKSTPSTTKISNSSPSKKELKLVLKKKWYDMIYAFIKKEEYRDITPYWIKRIFLNRIYRPHHLFEINDREASYFAKNPGALSVAIRGGYIVPKNDSVTFYLGYSKNRPSMTRKIGDISIGTGRKDWGAEPDKNYIKIGLI